MSRVPSEKSLYEELQLKLNGKTKPVRSLGRLEEIALQIGLVQKTVSPQLSRPRILLFASDHGLAHEGVSAYPQAVTYQMVQNFMNGGAAINVLSQSLKIPLSIVDAGVAHDFSNESFVKGLINNKVGYGTKNMLYEPAMSESELTRCFELAEHLIDRIADDGCNTVGFGEMGIGNTSSASIIMHKLTGISLIDCIGRGTGVSDSNYLKKQKVISDVVEFHSVISGDDPLVVLRTFGGFEIAQMCAAMLRAAKRGMIILIDGFISSSAYLVASLLNPAIKEKTICSHLSDEKGHSLLLDFLDKEPLLKLNMRLGEGTGCALAFPIVQAAIAILNDMASFEEANVQKSQE